MESFQGEKIDSSHRHPSSPDRRTGEISSEFRRKTYSKIDSSPIARPSDPLADLSKEKIIPSSATQSFRETLKKTFLPLLIEVFELRQAVQSAGDLPLDNLRKSLSEILGKLEQYRKDTEEYERWCQGVIQQITRTIEQAQELLSSSHTDNHKNSP